MHIIWMSWTSMQGEIRRLIHESTNSVDSNAAAVMKGQIVGHVPFNLAPGISMFFRRDVNKAFARVYWRESKSRTWIWV